MNGGQMLFHRDFTEYTGGQGKVWDYFRHTLALGWQARVFLTDRSLRDERNPWMQEAAKIETEWHPEDADVLFLGGRDWAALPDPLNPPRPVINLVQHVRHAWADYPLRQYLRAPAHRICVSQPVADAIAATGEVNGPLWVIPAALDVPEPVKRGMPAASGSVVIAGIKAPVLAHAIAAVLQARGVMVEVLGHWLPRADYLQRIAGAAVAVTLPHPQEGFYLPGLEAMALGVPVVMNDCIGSCEYARDGENCLLAVPEAEAMAAAVMRAMEPGVAAPLVARGRETAAAHTQAREREQFAVVLRAIREAVQ